MNIVERLRDDLEKKAADEIEKLRKQCDDWRYEATYMKKAYFVARKMLEDKYGCHMDYFYSRAAFDAIECGAEMTDADDHVVESYRVWMEKK